MRGLRNLTLTLNEAACYDEALAVCDRLETECGDDFTAASHRAAIYLNTGNWEQAARFASRSGDDLDPSAGFVQAFAFFELAQYGPGRPGRRPRCSRAVVPGELGTPLPPSGRLLRSCDAGRAWVDRLAILRRSDGDLDLC
jgi:hypothetical protein